MTTPTQDAVCLFGCGRKAEHRHHYTARAAGDDSRLDASTVGLCHRCHTTEHTAWRSVGLDVIGHPLAARVRRTTWTLGRLADLDRPVVLDPATLRGLHDVLIAIQVDVLALISDEEAP